MRIALRWKIALTFTLLTAVVLAALGAYLNALVVNRGVEIMRQGLVTEAHVLERQLAPPWRPSAGLQQRLVAFDRLAEARLTLIDAEGRVVGDSRDNPVLMGNHADRPERLEAIGEGTGSAIRFSETLRQPMLYVAVAVAVGAPGGLPSRGAASRPPDDRGAGGVAPSEPSAVRGLRRRRRPSSGWPPCCSPEASPPPSRRWCASPGA